MKAFTFRFLKFFLSAVLAIFMVSALSAQHDLELLKSASSATAEIGDQITFTLVVNNDAATTVTNVEVTDLLPAGALYVSHLPASESYDPLTGIWDLGTIQDTTSSRELNIIVEITSDGVIFNTAEITAMDGTDFDSAPGNGVIWEDDYATAKAYVKNFPSLINISWNWKLFRGGELSVFTEYAGCTAHVYAKNLSGTGISINADITSNDNIDLSVFWDLSEQIFGIRRSNTSFDVDIRVTSSKGLEASVFMNIKNTITNPFMIKFGELGDGNIEVEFTGNDFEISNLDAEIKAAISSAV